MANPYHHALSSQRKWGGEIEDYIAIHTWFDESKEHHGDFRHRALRHHSQGIFEAERVFGHTITLATGRAIPSAGSASSTSSRTAGESRPCPTGCAASDPSRG